MHIRLAAAAAIALVLATPVAAQQSSYKAGAYWQVARIKTEPGQFQNYMDFLTKTWADNQAYAKSQGWILDYHILDNINARDGEPDILLVTRFADYPSPAEAERRTQMIQKRMNQDDHSAEAASGDRAKMRRQMGSVLYQELLKR